MILKWMTASQSIDLKDINVCVDVLQNQEEDVKSQSQQKQ